MHQTPVPSGAELLDAPVLLRAPELGMDGRGLDPRRREVCRVALRVLDAPSRHDARPLSVRLDHRHTSRVHRGVTRSAPPLHPHRHEHPVPLGVGHVVAVEDLLEDRDRLLRHRPERGSRHPEHAHRRHPRHDLPHRPGLGFVGLIEHEERDLPPGGLQLMPKRRHAGITAHHHIGGAVLRLGVVHPHPVGANPVAEGPGELPHEPTRRGAHHDRTAREPPGSKAHHLGHEHRFAGPHHRADNPAPASP